MTGPDTLARAAAALARARSVVAITGAGISAESGLRTFRDTMEGLWKEFDPRTLATPEAFEENPERVTRWYDHRVRGCRDAAPNPGHAALARLESWLTRDRARSFTLLTQNVDRLHQRAGSRNVVELHGTIMRWRCTSCGREIEPPAAGFDSFPPPSPFVPGAVLRPCVVWFGEALPAEALRQAHDAVEACDCFLTIGTSSEVFPAAGFVHHAKRLGATCIEVNLDATPASRIVDHALRGRGGEILPALLDAIDPAIMRGGG